MNEVLPDSGVSAPKKIEAAFFDVDNTILRGSSSFLFGKCAYQSKFFTRKDLWSFAWHQMRFIAIGENNNTLERIKDRALALVAKRLGLTGALGTVLETKDGLLTGNLIGKALHGKAKRKAVRALAKERNIGLRKSYAYSDSHNDLPMLTLVGHAVAVNPDKILAVHAKAAGWRILDFKKRELRANKHLNH